MVPPCRVHARSSAGARDDHDLRRELTVGKASHRPNDPVERHVVGLDRPQFNNNRILLNELTVTGAFVYDADGFERALELLASPDFPTGTLIETDDVPLDRIIGAMRGLADGELAAKVMSVPRTG